MTIPLAAQSWPDRAACRDQDTELWFPVSPTGPPDRHAVATCAGCEVRLECLEFALANPKMASCGYWGGLTEDERKAERRRRQRRGAAA